jgi:uncharacterized membrane protein
MAEQISIVIIGSFVLAFKAVLVEGSEVAIIAVATFSQLGKRNVLAGVLLGALGSLGIFLAVREFFVLLPEIVVDLLTGSVLLYFSRKFLRGFVRYYFGKRSFRDKMKKIEEEVVEKDLAHMKGSTGSGVIPFSLLNSLPVFSITITEGFEASLVLAAAGAFNLVWTSIGAAVSITVLVVISFVSYDYLMRVPRWLLDLIAGVVLFSFGSFFFVTGLLLAFGLAS